MNRPPPHTDQDSFAYAVSYRLAAELIAPTVSKHSQNDLVNPFFMLVSSSIENALKAVLEFKRAPKSKEWTNSHDLSDLKARAENVGCTLAAEEARFVDELSPHHVTNQFRYPRNAGTALLPQGEAAMVLLENILRTVFHYVDGPQRI